MADLEHKLEEEKYKIPTKENFHGALPGSARTRRNAKLCCMGQAREQSHTSIVQVQHNGPGSAATGNRPRHLRIHYQLQQ